MSLNTFCLILISSHLLKGSYDNIEIDSEQTITSHNFTSYKWHHFKIRKMRPCRFFNLSVTGLTHDHNANLAIYGIEFFGDVYLTSRDFIRKTHCRGTKIEWLISLTYYFVLMIP